MKLYSEQQNYKLYHGSMLDLLEVIEENSIDSIVTDPPYELGFMNKGWDSSGIAFSKETWKKCLAALKPGGYLLAFGGSRTFHRIACAIEDAGFEIRDVILWLYGCYSADTQVLTDKGWKYFYDLERTEKVLQWNKESEQLAWIKPLNYFEYDIDEDMKLFENRHISQLVTQNHKVAVSVKKRRKDFEPYDLIEARDIKDSWILNFPLAGYMNGSVHEDKAYLIGWWLTDAWVHGDGKAAMFCQSKPKTLAKLKDYFDQKEIKYSEYTTPSKNEKHNDEHVFYVTGPSADFLLKEYPTRELNWAMLDWDIESKLALIEGLMDGDGSYRPNEYAMNFWSCKEERLDIFQALCISVGYRAYVDHNNHCVTFNTNKRSTQTQTRHHKADIHYTGKVYCLQTETGAFVVRRNGKAFISGNSGFPKSMDLEKAINKRDGVEFSSKPASGVGFMNSDDDGYHNTLNQLEQVGESTERAAKFSGWGTSLKPSYEPVIVARKPCEGNTLDNVLKYGVGGINIGECRVGNEERTYGNQSLKKPEGAGCFRDDNWVPKEYKKTVNGRFPSNVILTYDESDKEEVCGGMPDTKGNGNERHNNNFGREHVIYGDYASNVTHGYDDSGSAARYYYCAKASTRDRDEGLDSFETGYIGASNQIQAELKRGNVDFKAENDNPMNRIQAKKNTHPTVKPTDLMQYLVRLVTPADGTVLDPFNGSGSTGKAVMYENRDHNKNYKYIGIEITEAYLPIAQARIEYAINHIEVADEAEQIPGQMSLFDL